MGIVLYVGLRCMKLIKPHDNMLWKTTTRVKRELCMLEIFLCRKQQSHPLANNVENLFVHVVLEGAAAALQELWAAS